MTFLIFLTKVAFECAAFKREAAALSGRRQGVTSLIFLTKVAFECAAFKRGAPALRGRRQGATRPPAPPAQGFAPGNPDSMHTNRKWLMRMPLICRDLLHWPDWLAHTRGMRQCAHYATDITCRGSGGVLRPPVGSARGKARSHARSATAAHAGGSARGRARSHARSAAAALRKGISIDTPAGAWYRRAA